MECHFVLMLVRVSHQQIPDVTIDKDNSDHVKMVKIRDGVVRFFNEVCTLNLRL